MAESDHIAALFDKMSEDSFRFAESLKETSRAIEAIIGILDNLCPAWEWLELPREPVDWCEWLHVAFSYVIERRWSRAFYAWAEAQRSFWREVDRIGIEC